MFCTARGAEPLTFVGCDKSKQKHALLIRPQVIKITGSGCFFTFLFAPFLLTVAVKTKFLLIGNFYIATVCFTAARLPDSSDFRQLITIEPLQIPLAQKVFCLLFIRAFQAHPTSTFVAATVCFSGEEFLFTLFFDIVFIQDP